MITTKHEMHELERKNKFVYKPINCIYKDLVEIFNSSIDIEEFSSHEYVMRAMNDLAFQARRNALCPCMFELAEGKILHVCINPRIDNCQRFKILARASGRTYCDKCNEDLRAINRRQERKELGFGKRIESSSHVAIAHLSPESTQKRFANRRIDKMNLSQKVSQLELQLQAAQESHMIPLTIDNVKEFVGQAFHHITSTYDRKKLKEEIINAILSCESIDCDIKNKEETNKFAERVCNMLDAESSKLKGNDTGIRYDYRIKRLALSHYLQFGKTAYNQLRECSLEVLPSERTNEYRLSLLRGGSGCHVALNLLM